MFPACFHCVSRFRFGATLLMLPLVSAQAQIPAFPGAEGFGSIATGGRGGDVYYVTNLNASGAGSFSNGIQTAPETGRTILFAVSGHIRLPSGSGGGLTINKNKITVAGQSAPGDGICFWNNTMNMTGNDLVFRNLRWRYGKQVAGGDAVDVSSSQRIIFDHCEMMFSTDENMSFFGTAPEHFTFQWSINAWGLSGHSAGGLWKIKHGTASHTLWANNHTRNPKLIGADVFDWVNNVTFGWNNGFNLAQEITGGTGFTYRINVRGSSFIHGAYTGDAMFGGGANDDGSKKFKVHVSDSALDGSTPGVLDVSRTDYGIISSGSEYDAIASAWSQSTEGNPANPLIGVPVSTSSRLLAYKKVLSLVGATRMEASSTRPLRDEISQTCVDVVANQQRIIISDPLQLGLSTGTAFASLVSASAPADSDQDGLPDYWEEALALNPALANNNDVLSAPELLNSYFPPGTPVGYTRLEEYLHFLANPHAVTPKNSQSSASFIDIDLRKYTSGFTNTPTFTVSNVLGGTFSQSGLGGAIVRFTPTPESSGRAGFSFTVTDSAGDAWTQRFALLVTVNPLPRQANWVGDNTLNLWDTVTPNFSTFSGPSAFVTGDAVRIDDSGSNTPSVKVVGALAPASLTVDNSTKAYVIEGSGSLSGTGGLTKFGSAGLTLRVNHSGNGKSLIDGSTVTLGGTSNTGTLPTGQLTFQNGASLVNAWPNSSSTQNIQAPLFIPAGHSATIHTGRRIQLSGSVTGAGDLTINHQGTDGVIQLRGPMNSFSGNLTITYSGVNGAMSAIYNGASFNGWGAANVNFATGVTLNCTTNSTGNTFSIGALSGGGTLNGGSSGPPFYNIGGLGIDTVFAGSFGGNANVTKTGNGKLTLTGASIHSGATTVSSGELAMLGSFASSPVTVSSGAKLTGTGSFAGTVTGAAGAIFAPGADSGAGVGTLTVGSLALTAPVLRFDLSSNPLLGNDQIVSSSGPITLTGAQNFEFNLLDNSLSEGTYELISSPSALTANALSFVSNLPSNSRQSLSLQYSLPNTTPGYVRLVVVGNNANLVWTGSGGGIWDQQVSSPWSGATPATFFNFDNVTFDDSAPSGTGTVALRDVVSPQSITVNNGSTRPYTLSGSPITGSASLTKSGAGTLTLNLPQYAIQAGVLSGSATVTVDSTTGLTLGMSVYGTEIPAGTKIATIPNATSFTLSAPASASNASAALTCRTENTFTGGTILNSGTLLLTSNALPAPNAAIPPPANTHGLGTGPITLNGGTLTLYGGIGGMGDYLYGALPNALVVPNGATATLNNTRFGTAAVPYSALAGKLTGSGTLNLTVNHTRGSITGDWSEFAGRLNVGRPSGGTTDPRFILANPAGLPLATVVLDLARLNYSAVPDLTGTVVPIGSLAGNSTSRIQGSNTGGRTLTWRVGGLGTDAVFAGTFLELLPGSTRTGIIKTGGGTWTLTGGGTLDGGIQVEDGRISFGDASTDNLGGIGAIEILNGGTFQLNGANLSGSSCDVASGGSFTGRGSVLADFSNGGLVSVTGGTLAITGDVFLGGVTAFSSLSDRIQVNGNLSLGGRIDLPSSGLSFGRKVLITYSGGLTTGAVSLGSTPSQYLPVLDLGVAGEVAVKLVDNTAYQAWQTTYFGSTVHPDSLALADPDGDGMQNVEEFEAGTIPTNAASFVTLVWQGGGANAWDNGATANWLENATLRVFRNKRHVSLTDAGSYSPTLDLREDLQPGSLTVNVMSKACSLTGNGTLQGPMSLTKLGSNTLTMATQNGYSGSTLIQEGILTVQNNLALGSSLAGTVVANNARLELDGGVQVSGESLTITGQGGSAFFTGALNAKSGNNLWAGPITLLGANTRIGAQAGATLEVSGIIGDSGAGPGLVVRPADASATVVLSGANTYSGSTALFGGKLKLAGGPNRLPISTNLVFGASIFSGELDLNGCDQTLTGLSVSGGTANILTNTAAEFATLKLVQSGTSTLPIPLSGNLGFTFTGGGSLTLQSSQSYTGATKVSGATLRLNFANAASPTNLLVPSAPVVLEGAELVVTGKSGANVTTQTFGGLTLSPNTANVIRVVPNGGTSTRLDLGAYLSIGADATLLVDLSAAGNASVAVNPALEGSALAGVTVTDAGGTGPAIVFEGNLVRYTQLVLDSASNNINRDFTTLGSLFPAGTLDWTNGGNLTNRSVNSLILDATQAGAAVSINLGVATNILTIASGQLVFQGSQDMTLVGGQIGPANSSLQVNVNGAKKLTLASLLSGGSGTVSLSGSGTLVLNHPSPNSLAGGIIVDGGTLKPGNVTAFGSNAVTLNQGTLDGNGLSGTSLSSLQMNGGTVDLNGGSLVITTLAGNAGVIQNSFPASTAVVTLGSAVNQVFAGTLQDVGTGQTGITKSGNGVMTLSSPNNHTGITTIQSGTLRSAANDALGNGPITINAGVLDVQTFSDSVGLVMLRGGTITGTTGVLSADSYDMTSGTVSAKLGGDSAGLVKSGTSATLVLSGENSYGGNTQVLEGVVSLQHASALGSTSVGTVVSNAARVELSGNRTYAPEPITISGSGTSASTGTNGALRNLSGTNVWTGPIRLGANNSRVGAIAGTLTLSGVIDDGADTFNITVRNSDTTGVVVFAGANTYGGNTQIIGGVAMCGGGDNRLPVTTQLQLGGSAVSGKFDLNGFNQRLAGIAQTQTSGVLTNHVTNSSATRSTLSLWPLSTMDLVVPVIGNITLEKSGPATLSVLAPMSYTGPTQILGGVLKVNFTGFATPTNALNPVSELSLAGGEFHITGKPGAVCSQSLANLTLAPGSTNKIVLTPNGATSLDLVLGNAWNIGAGATLEIDLSAPGASSVTSSPAFTGFTLQGVTVKDAGGTGPATVLNGKLVRYTKSVLAEGSNDNTREFSSLQSVYNSGVLLWTQGGLLGARAVHTLYLDSSIQGGTIDMGAAANVLSLDTSSGSGMVFFEGSQPITLTGGQLGASNIPLSLITKGTSTLTIQSLISGGTGAFTIAGTATVNLSNSNNFSGGLVLESGVLRQSTLGALGTTNNSVTVNDGMLDLNGIATSIGNLNGSGGSIVNNASSTQAVLSLGNGNTGGGTYSGNLLDRTSGTGTLALTKTGTGSLVLAGQNNYSGPTLVTAGTLRMGSDNALSGSSLTITGNAVCDLQSFNGAIPTLVLTSGTLAGTGGKLTATSFDLTSGTVSARLGGSGAVLSKSGIYTQVVSLAAANDYSGPTTLQTNSGVLAIAHAQALDGTSAVTLAGGGTALRLANGIQVAGKSVTIRGTGANNGSVGNFSGALTSADNASAAWHGPVILADANARIGTGNAGMLEVSGPISGDGVNQNLSISAGSGSSSNIGTVLLSAPSGQNTFTGTISIVRGTLRLGATNSLPLSAILDVGSASVADSTRFELNGFSQTIAGLRRTSTHGSQLSAVSNSAPTPATLTINQSLNTVYSGRITGNLALQKSGAGALTLSSTLNTYTGNTTVSAGTLTINNPFLSDVATLSISAGAKMTLNFSGNDTIATLILGGTVLPPGTYNATTHPAYFNPGTGNVVVPGGYSGWIDSFAGLTTEEKAMNADPDEDGSSNFAEFAFGGHPADPAVLPTSQIRTLDANGDLLPDLTLTLSVRTNAVFTNDGPDCIATADGISYRIEGTLDLIQFNATVNQVQPAQGVGSPPPGYSFRTFRLVPANGLPTRGFLRASASSP